MLKKKNIPENEIYLEISQDEIIGQLDRNRPKNIFNIQSQSSNTIG